MMKADGGKNEETMKPYTKTYYSYFGYYPGEFVPCEVCGAAAVDTHHIKARGMGGTKEKWYNQIENLMALCRKCHDDYGDKGQFIDFLKRIHKIFLFRCTKDNEREIFKLE